MNDISISTFWQALWSVIQALWSIIDFMLAIGSVVGGLLYLSHLIVGWPI